jgi:glutamate N-acetyltransferase/amino-acid N-acetyltransferase
MAEITSVSPFAPATPLTPRPVAGVTMAAVEAGIKYKGRKDLLLATLTEGTVCAGVTTRSKTCSAPVLWCREQLTHGNARALVVNAGNANAFTGKRGAEAARLTAEAAASAVGCTPETVFLASTGVIGEPMDASGFGAVLADLAPKCVADGWSDAAATIMTTDTFPKVAATTVTLDDTEVTISGIAKGSGMIAPDMATMLAFVFTDAAIDCALLQDIVSAGNDKTFNCITVDGDTSTSDTLLVFATGAAGGTPITSRDDPRCATFAAALDMVLHELALLIAKDGEGISKFITVEVDGAETDAAAKRIALSIANSPLVKTAVAGEDANWGRVVMAVGKAGEAADRDALSIWFGDHLVADKGERASGYSEDAVSAYMKEPEILIRSHVGIGDGRATVWTCDLTHGYISINADYRS